MLIAYMKSVEIDEVYHQYLTIKTNNLITIKKTNLDCITVSRNLKLNNKLGNKKYVDESLRSGNVLRFKKKHYKVSVGNDVYNLTKYDRMQITDITLNKNSNTSCYLLQNWVINCDDKK